jgi:hypothetical protein
MARSVRGIAALVAGLLLPACNLTYVPDQSLPASDPSGPSFGLLLPLNGELQALENPEFAWYALDGATGYGLEISTTSDFSTIVWDDPSLTITSTFLTQVTLTNFTYFFWRVYGLQPGGASVLAPGSPYQFRTRGGGVTTPTGFAPLYPSGSVSGVDVSPLFSWQASVGATSYTIEIDSAGTFSPPEFVESDLHINRATLTTALDRGKSYAWRVLATGQLGNRYSSTGSFTTAP